jgi:hypothetical protein
VVAHAFEPELDQTIPRRIAGRDGCAYGGLLWAGRVLFLPHTVIGLVFLYRAVVTSVLNLGVLVVGVPAAGHVTGKSEDTSRRGVVHYTVEYVFTLDGAVYSGQVFPDADGYAAVEVGQPVDVVAFRRAPADAHWPGLPGHSPSRDVLQAIGTALFWNGIVLATWWWLAVRPWRRRQLVRYGVPTAGRVREVTKTPGKTDMGYLRYEYPVGPAGESRSRSVEVHLRDVADLKAGDTLTVLYDPARPRRSLVYRLSPYQAVPPKPADGSGR